VRSKAISYTGRHLAKCIRRMTHTMARGIGGIARFPCDSTWLSCLLDSV